MIDKLSVRTPPGEVKLKVLKEIAKEYQIDWDTAESEKELLKPPEELIVCVLFLFIYHPLSVCYMSLAFLCCPSSPLRFWLFSLIRKGSALLSVPAPYQWRLQQLFPWNQISQQQGESNNTVRIYDKVELFRIWDRELVRKVIS